MGTSMLFSFARYLSVFLVFGFLPIYLTLRLLKHNIRPSLVLGIGFAPVIIALINTLTVLFSQNGYFLPWTISLLYDLIICFYLIKGKTKRIIHRFLIKPLFIRFLFAVFIAAALWVINFYPQIKSGLYLYGDTVWNFGHIAEIKNHFPPIDPHWYTGKVFIYHYLTDAYLAGVSAFSGLSITTASAIINPFITYLSICLILIFMARNKHVYNSLILGFIVLFSNFTNDWLPFSSFSYHMSGAAFNTFFWSIPIFLSGFYSWISYDRGREDIILNKKNPRYMNKFILIFITILIIIFAKASYVITLFFLELFSSLHIFLKLKLWKQDNARHLKSFIIAYSLLPIASLIIAGIFFSASPGIIKFGLKRENYYGFGSNPIKSYLYALTAVYGILLVYMAISVRKLNKLHLAILFASLGNFILFLVTIIPGSSNLYFIFTAFLLNMLIVLFISDKNGLIKFSLSFILMIFIASFLGPDRGFKPFPLDKHSGYANTRLSDQSFFHDKEIGDLIELKSFLKKNSLVLFPDAIFENGDFRYSAFLETRIWAESNVYAPTTINLYTKRFNSKQYLLEDPLSRAVIQKEFAYGPMKNLHDYDQMKNKYGWTHVLVRNENIKFLSEYLKNKKNKKGYIFTIIEL